MKKEVSLTFLRITSSPCPREVLAAKQKNLARQGKGNRPNATRELTEAEEDALFENGQFSVQDPKSLQRALWWFLSLHFLSILAEGLAMKAGSCVGEM